MESGDVGQRRADVGIHVHVDEVSGAQCKRLAPTRLSVLNVTFQPRELDAGRVEGAHLADRCLRRSRDAARADITKNAERDKARDHRRFSVPASVVNEHGRMSSWEAEP